MKSVYHDALLLPQETPTRWDVFRRVGLEWHTWLWRQTSVWIAHAKQVSKMLKCRLVDVMACLMHPELWSPRVRPIVEAMRTLLIEDLSWTDQSYPQEPERIVAVLEPWVYLQGSDWRQQLDVIMARHVAGLRQYDPTAVSLDNMRAKRRIRIGLGVVLKFHPSWLGVTSGFARAYRATT